MAIDNAKRAFDIDLTKEIDLIKKDMNIEENGLPLFWQITKKDKRKCASEEEKKKRRKVNKEKIKAKLNEELVCPMNYLYGLDLDKHRSSERTIPIKEFLKLDLSNNDRRKSKAVEELIEKYALEQYDIVMDLDGANWKENNYDLLLRWDFDNLINDIQKIYISRNYKGLMSWLINRAFEVTAGVKRNSRTLDSITDKNKSLLLKVLYTINKDVFMSCFKSCTLDKNEHSQTQ